MEIHQQRSDIQEVRERLAGRENNGKVLDPGDGALPFDPGVVAQVIVENRECRTSIAELHTKLDREVRDLLQKADERHDECQASLRRLAEGGPLPAAAAQQEHAHDGLEEVRARADEAKASVDVLAEEVARVAKHSEAIRDEVLQAIASLADPVVALQAKGVGHTGSSDGGAPAPGSGVVSPSSQASPSSPWKKVGRLFSSGGAA